MFHFNHNYAVYIGEITENVFHKHYALQISIALTDSLETQIEGDTVQQTSCVIFEPQIIHRLISRGEQLTLLINPLSKIGHNILDKGKSGVYDTDELIPLLKCLFKDFLERNSEFESIMDKVDEVLNQYACSCKELGHNFDYRIKEALMQFEKYHESTFSLEEISSHVHLSPSRFLHLFKQETGMTFRRYQLWNKVIKSIPLLKHFNITETAHALGFTDSAHYTKAFKESFGITPKFIKRLQ